MKSIAVLLTCYNRKEKTLKCLNALYGAFGVVKNQLEMDVYLTDDGSTDGTAGAVAALFPEVKVLTGTGSLYWAGGMRNSWKEALKLDYEGYLWLNDDALMNENYFTQLLEAEAYCIEKFKMGGIYIGSTHSSVEKKWTYGGHVFTNKFLNKTKHLIPTNDFQLAELGNGNITFISKDVVTKIGVFRKGIPHGADYDYTYYAFKKKLPVLVMPNYLGICDNDHDDKYEKFVKLSLVERYRFMFSPIGFQFGGSLLFQKRFFPYRVPFVLFGGFLKVVFPSLYILLSKIRNK